MHVAKKLDNFNLSNEFESNFIFSKKDEVEAIFVRSSSVPSHLIKEKLLIIGRAGVGLNGIDIDKCTKNGTLVMNTPGTNTIAVKELALQCLLRSVRPLNNSINKTMTLIAEDLQKKSEELRPNYIGSELFDRNIGIIGLGNIGQSFGNICQQLNMNVFGYDKQKKKKLPFKQCLSIKELLKKSDFIIIFLPLLKSTYHLINKELLSCMRKDVIILNFGRGEVVNNKDLLSSMNNGIVQKYITDFPDNELRNHKEIIMLPHLGGNTTESIERSEKAILSTTKEFLDTGNVSNSVNFPSTSLPFTSKNRFTFFYINELSSNIENKIVTIFMKNNIKKEETIKNMVNNHIYMIVNTDYDKNKATEILKKLNGISGMIKVRFINRNNL